jgi:putative FmdB family regulatory protein
MKMPTYEYRCEKCGHEFEEFQSITAKPIKKCPSCGKLAVKRLISAGVGIIFRGSGFYETDYRSEQYQAAAKKDSEAGKSGTAAPAAAGDAKTDAKTASQTGSKGEAKSESKVESKSEAQTPAPANAAASGGGDKNSAPPRTSKPAKK